MGICPERSRRSLASRRGKRRYHPQKRRCWGWCGLIIGPVAPNVSSETLDRWGGPSNGSTGSVGGYRSTTLVVAAPLDAAEQAALNEAILEV